MYFIFLSLFFLAPVSSFQEVPVPIFGKTHHFPNAIYSRIFPASPDDAEAIASLSVDMPLIYQGGFAAEISPFRRPDAYRRLLLGKDVKARARKKEHFIFVFKNEKGHITGYIHGSIYLQGKSATIDELVVHPAWRNRGVGRALLGRLMREFSRRGKTAVNIFTRVPISEKITGPFGLEWNFVGFDLSLVTDHLISRTSLNYLMHQKVHNPSLYAELSQEIKAVLREAKTRDQISTADMMSYLASLVRPMDEAIQEKLLQEGKNFYYGIQDDRIELANMYFLMYLICVLASEDENPVDRAFYKHRNLHFLSTLNELKEAQRQGGFLPADIQIFLGRLHAFARIYEGIEKGSPLDKTYVQKSIRAYLKLIDLREIGGRPVYVTPSRIETLLREILWFRYPYWAAAKMASLFMKMQRDYAHIFRYGVRSTARKEVFGAVLFKRIRNQVWKELRIDLAPEFGLLFLYTLPLNYGKAEEILHRKIGEIFSRATFYTYDPVKKEWGDRVLPDLDLLLDGSGAKLDESTDGAEIFLEKTQRARLLSLLRYFFDSTGKSKAPLVFLSSVEGSL